MKLHKHRNNDVTLRLDKDEAAHLFHLIRQGRKVLAENVKDYDGKLALDLMRQLPDNSFKFGSWYSI